ncbi:hypothetical protein [Skermanella stibiiresistens]|uniref:hypothetical protein n=1 Tax=Skermanella stibiiresistens TaxID=913326 RepID=UPI0004BAF9BB|nr:hypothetical protein [Skermanella stibiiresistens]
MSISSPKAAVAHKDPKLPPAPAVPEGDAWIGALRTLGAGTAVTLEAVVRTLYPHDGLPDRVYRRVVLHFDRLAGAFPGLGQSVAEVIDHIEAALPLPFAERSESYRVAALRSIEGSAAFTLIQRTAVRFLYDDVEIWEAFGYEGASHHLGGYVERGFDDLDWLPEPPPLPTDI